MPYKRQNAVGNGDGSISAGCSFYAADHILFSDMNIIKPHVDELNRTQASIAVDKDDFTRIICISVTPQLYKLKAFKGVRAYRIFSQVRA